MKSYGWSCLLLLSCFFTNSTTADSEESTISSIVEGLLYENHPCLSVRYETNVNISKLLGRWYALALLCPGLPQIPVCDTVDFKQIDPRQIHQRWRSLAEKKYRSTILNVVEPGLWLDIKPDRAHSIYLVLSTWHPYYAVLMRCYPNPCHSQDVYVLGRDTEFVKRDLDMLVERAKEQGVDKNLMTQYLLWSMCGEYLPKLKD